jgi:hypothetical protein
MSFGCCDFVDAIELTLERLRVADFSGTDEDLLAQSRLACETIESLHSALAAIAGMVVNENTDHAQLTALCLATAKTALECKSALIPFSELLSGARFFDPESGEEWEKINTYEAVCLTGGDALEGGKDSFCDDDMVEPI